jgi:hypothetical protein
LARPSTPLSARDKDVDTRIKSAQDDFRLIPANCRLGGVTGPTGDTRGSE